MDSSKNPSKNQNQNQNQGGGRVVGEYILGPRIGSGSFAEVWLSRHRQTGMEVAVKEIDKKRLSPKVSQNLLKEIQILTTINHPNIIRLFQAIQTSDKIYLVLEYCQGGDLAAYIHRNGKVSHSVASHFMNQLALGLQVLQEKHLIHRDLKPQNLLLASNDLTPVLKLGDFGFARSLTQQELADTLCGSPLYMAPEIIQNKKYDAKADLWSVGAVLFQLVTGKPPYDGNNPTQLFRNILASTEPRFPEGSLEELHPDCVDLCKSLLRQDPVQRITFNEFFAHKFLREHSLEVNVEQSSMPPQAKSMVEHFDSSSTGKNSGLRSGDRTYSSSANLEANLEASSPARVKGVSRGKDPVCSTSTKNLGCSKVKTSADVVDSLESIERGYVLVNPNFASKENFSYYLETSVHDASATRDSICSLTKSASDETKELGQLQIADTYPLDKSHSSTVLREVQVGLPILHATRLQLFRQYLQALTDLAQEMCKAGCYRESFSVELVILATWKQALQICSSWTTSTQENIPGTRAASESPLLQSDSGTSYPEDNVDFCRPSLVHSWAKRGFIAAYDRTKTLSDQHIQSSDATLEMPDAMEIIYQKALALGKSGAVDDYFDNKEGAASAYSRSILLFSFIMGEATTLALNPPFSLALSDKLRIQNYIGNLQSRLSNFLPSPSATK
ncbi:hypothetical protein ACFE04_018776 [Oxalis oulophora]